MMGCDDVSFYTPILIRKLQEILRRPNSYFFAWHDSAKREASCLCFSRIGDYTLVGKASFLFSRA